MQSNTLELIQSFKVTTRNWQSIFSLTFLSNCKSTALSNWISSSTKTKHRFPWEPPLLVDLQFCEFLFLLSEQVKNQKAAGTVQLLTTNGSNPDIKRTLFTSTLGTILLSNPPANWALCLPLVVHDSEISKLATVAVPVSQQLCYIVSRHKKLPKFKNVWKLHISCQVSQVFF